jgi:peptidoglycan hydrolase CwlO-like protein
MKSLSNFVISALAVLLFSLSSQASFSQSSSSQSFTSLDSDLQLLENLINDTLQNTEEQQKLLDDLRRSLDESGNLIGSYETIISEQENLLKELREQLAEMSETYRTRSALSETYGQKLRFWRTFTLIAIPAAAAISGGIVWGLAR